MSWSKPQNKKLHLPHHFVSLPTQTYDNMHMAAATTPTADTKQYIAATNTCSQHQPIPQLTASTWLLPPHLLPTPTHTTANTIYTAMATTPVADTKQQFHWPMLLSCILIGCIPTSCLLDMHPLAAYPLASIGLYIITFTSINADTAPLMQYLHIMWLCPMWPSQITHYTWCGLLLTQSIFFLYITYFLFLHLCSYFHAMKITWSCLSSPPWV